MNQYGEFMGACLSMCPCFGLWFFIPLLVLVFAVPATPVLYLLARRRPEPPHGKIAWILAAVPGIVALVYYALLTLALVLDLAGITEMKLPGWFGWEPSTEKHMYEAWLTLLLTLNIAVTVLLIKRPYLLLRWSLGTMFGAFVGWGIEQRHGPFLGLCGPLILFPWVWACIACFARLQTLARRIFRSPTAADAAATELAQPDECAHPTHADPGTTPNQPGHPRQAK